MIVVAMAANNWSHRVPTILKLQKLLFLCPFCGPISLMFKKASSFQRSLCFHVVSQIPQLIIFKKKTQKEAERSAIKSEGQC